MHANTISVVENLPERVGTAFPIVKSVYEHIMDGIVNHFPADMHYIAGFCAYNLKIFPG